MINTMIPSEQRGFYSAITQWQGLFVSFIVSGLGVLLGKHLLSNHNAYSLILLLSIFPTIPLGLIGARRMS